jgi:hypothetical protein
LAGTFAPFFRASDKPIAIACSRLFTLPPRPPFPLLSVPRLRRRMALFTLLAAPLLYFRPLDFRDERFLVAIETSERRMMRAIGCGQWLLLLALWFPAGNSIVQRQLAHNK